MKERNLLLDVLKGVAIIAVMLYHLGVMPNGYLGVEVFLVVAGYLTTKSIVKAYRTDNFGYWSFINNRLVRLWPLLVIVSAVALALGWLWMLPIHYKLNCEAVAGTCIFVNNIVHYITCGGYWEGANIYKPLMHTWYIAIMMQFYVLFPILFWACKKFSANWHEAVFYTMACVFLLSIGLFLSPIMTNEQNFYLLPSRLFEFMAGGMVAIYPHIQKDERIDKNRKFHIIVVLVALLILAILSNLDLDAKKTRLLITVAGSTMFMVWAESGFIIPNWFIFRLVSLCGVASYSLYLTHQVFFAFYRYAFNDIFNALSYSAMAFAALLIGFAVYYVLEKQISQFISGCKKRVYGINGLSTILSLLIMFVAGYYFMQGGLVRDIPELDLYLGKNSENPEEYNEKPRIFDKNFVENGKQNILVLGDSFGRDWVNILIESGVDSVMNISYHDVEDEVLFNRMKKADFVFVASNSCLVDKYKIILPLIVNKNFYRVGVKGYGSWIGIVYNNDRYGSSYFAQKLPESAHSRKANDMEKEMYGDRFIDMMSIMKDENGYISIFNDNHKLITQDGLHITRAGAIMYAQKLNVWQYLK